MKCSFGALGFRSASRGLCPRSKPPAMLVVMIVCSSAFTGALSALNKKQAINKAMTCGVVVAGVGFGPTTSGL